MYCLVKNVRMLFCLILVICGIDLKGCCLVFDLSDRS